MCILYVHHTKTIYYFPDMFMLIISKISIFPLNTHTHTNKQKNQNHKKTSQSNNTSETTTDVLFQGQVAVLFCLYVT